ncbi:hypothetical protein ACFL5L_01180 [candidate division KSB1 bacterium]
MVEPLEDVLTFERIYRGSEESGEYILARPGYFAVNAIGDVYFADEGIIKVFDESGNPKQIIGSIGQGPGEFEYATYPQFGPAGFLTVSDNYSICIFDRENNYIDKQKLFLNPRYIAFAKKHNFNGVYPLTAVSFDEKSRIVYLRAISPQPDDPFIYHRVIVYETPDSLYMLADYKSKEEVAAGRIITHFPYRGRTLYEVVSDNKIVYTNPAYDTFSNDSGSFYTLHYVTLSGIIRQEFMHPYEPIAVADSLKERFSLRKYDRNVPEDILEFLDKIDSETRYAAPVHRLIADRGRLFVFTYKQNITGEYLADIFDADTGEYIKSAYLKLCEKGPFNFTPPYDRSQIKNGCLYRHHEDEDGFIIVEKYRIDPNVYEK